MFSYNYFLLYIGQIMSLIINSIKNNIPRVIVAICIFLTVLYCMELSSLVYQNEPTRREIRDRPRITWSLGIILVHENAVKIATMLRTMIAESLALCLDVNSLLTWDNFSFLLSCIWSNQNNMESIMKTLISLQL
jgi:hypothetical protein